MGRRRGKPRPRRERPLAPGHVRVNGKSHEWLRKGFPWVYPDEVTAGAPAEPGARVVIEGPDGTVHGTGLGDTGWISVRRYRTDDGPLDRAWLDGVLDRAVRLRERCVLGSDTTCCRLVNGENDGLPGIRVELWDRWATVALDTPAALPLAPMLAEALADRLGVRGAWLCWRPDPRDTARDLPAPRWLLGEGPPGGEVEVRERGLRLGARPDEGPDVGVYVDMRDVRAWLAPHWAGRRVLNTFAYTGAFSAAAAVGGAAEVVSVDLSRPSLDRLVGNLARNHVPADAHEVVEDDVFKALDRFRRTGRRFDVVVVDPPSFSHGPAGTWSAKQDLPRLVAGAARVADDDGWLVIASNQGQISPRAFRGAVEDGLGKAGRAARELAFLGASPDVPAGVGFPEGHYLKVGVWALD